VELFISGRFMRAPRHESAVEEALRNVVAPTREEVGCLSIQAFDHHAGLPRLTPACLTENEESPPRRSVASTP
jgi:quinol monooxygenase YgiN